jgi:dTDP-4-dehydrorhamnose reductase
MKVMVTGAKGMLGSQVCNALAPQHEVVAVDIEDFDITDTGAVRARVIADFPDVVVHCAAWTDVDGCERDPAKAFLCNSRGTWAVAEACGWAVATLVYISTDFVFDGEKGEPYTEFDRPNPLGVYAASKLAGEETVRRLVPEHYVVRSAWLYGPGGNNFVDRILSAAAEREELRVVADQFGSPTYSRDLARTIADVIVPEQMVYGTYHVVNSGVCSWAELAAEALQIRGSGTRVVPIRASEWPSPTRRPAYSALRSRWLEFQGVPPLRDWKAALRSYLTGED